MSLTELFVRSAYISFQSSISSLQLLAVQEQNSLKFANGIADFKSRLDELEREERAILISNHSGFPIDIDYLRTMSSVLELGLEPGEQIQRELEVYYRQMPKLPEAVPRYARGF